MTGDGAGHSFTDMKHEPVPSGKRRAVTLSLAEERAADAESLGIDMEDALDRALATEIKRERDRRWREENREWIDAHRRWVEVNELPLERYRLF